MARITYISGNNMLRSPGMPAFPRIFAIIALGSLQLGLLFVVMPPLRASNIIQDWIVPSALVAFTSETGAWEFWTRDYALLQLDGPRNVAFSLMLSTARGLAYPHHFIVHLV